MTDKPIKPGEIFGLVWKPTAFIAVIRFIGDQYVDIWVSESRNYNRCTLKDLNDRKYHRRNDTLPDAELRLHQITLETHDARERRELEQLPWLKNRNRSANALTTT